MKNLVILISGLCLSIAAYAQDGERWYTAEAIIFAYTSSAGVQEERWPEDPGSPDTTGAITLVTPDSDELLPGQLIEFQKLPLETLKDSLRTLKRSSRYRVIDAMAWRFHGLPLKSSLPVRVRAGKRYTLDGDSAPPMTVPSSATGGVEGFIPEDTALYELDGRIRISLTKFLDVDADLIYRTHVMLPDTVGGITSQFQGFRLNEFRRMKSSTIHYLDHPMYGLVIAIDRYEQPEAETISDAAPTAKVVPQPPAPTGVQ